MAIGDLTQILTEDKMDTATVDFNDYEASTTGMPDLTTAMSNIKANSLFGVIFSNIKAALYRLNEKFNLKVDKTQIVQSLNITSNDSLMGGKTVSDEFTRINDILADNEFTITPNTNYIVDANLTSLHRINKRCDVSFMIRYSGGSFAAGAYHHVATLSEKPTKNTYLASNSAVNGSGGSIGSSSAYIDADGKIYIAIGATISNPYFFISGHFFTS